MRSLAGSWLVPLALLAFCLGLNVHAARSLDMHRVSPVWVDNAAPVALANLEFGHRSDYTGSIQVLGLFRDAIKKYPGATLNQQLRYALDHRDAVHEHLAYLAGYDDKGIIDFLKLGFFLFGYTLKSAIDLYFLLLGLSSLLFLLRFRREKWALILLFGFLLAHYCLLPAVALNPQLRSVLALRFMSVLSMVAALHLALDVVLPRPGALRWLTLFAQAALLFFTLHIRFAAIWQVIGVAMVYVLALAWRYYVRPQAEAGTVRWSPSLVPVLLAVLAAMSLGVYKRTVYAEKYFVLGNDAHVFWHSVYSGLAFSPELAERYGLRIDDASIFTATQRYLLKRGRVDEWQQLQGANGLYDTAVRGMFFHTLRHRLGTVVLAVVVHKPLALLHYLGWFMRLEKEPPCVNVLWDGAADELRGMADQMEEDGSFFRPFRLECLLPLVVFIAWAWRDVGPHWKRWAAAFAVFLGCSALPSLLGYPTAHTIGDFVIAAGMAIYLGMTAAVALLLRRLWGERPVLAG
jgi:hypothetical protein